MQIGRMTKKMNMLRILCCMTGITSPGLLQLLTVLSPDHQRLTSQVLPVVIKFHTSLVLYLFMYKTPSRVEICLSQSYRGLIWFVCQS